MAFDKFEEGKKRGESYPLGFTKRKILLFLAEAFPEKVKEKKIRLFLREEFDISGNTGIKRHLSELKEEDCLHKEREPGIANFWKLEDSYDKFKNIAERFLLREENLTDFIRSNYVSQMIDEDFVDYFAPEWGSAYLNKRDEFLENKEESENGVSSFLKIGEMTDKIEYDLDSQSEDELRKWFFDSFRSLDKKELIVILKTSPSALENFLFPEQLLKDSNLFRFIAMDNYFVYPFILDIIRHGGLESGKLKTEINLEYLDMKGEEPETLIDAKSKLNLQTSYKIEEGEDDEDDSSE